MFATRTPDYADDRRIGGAAGPFDTRADVYVRIAEMTRLRQADRRLRQGRQIVRAADREPGLFALSRLDETGETLVLFNTSTMPLARQVVVEAGSSAWRGIRGRCATNVSAPGSLAVSVPPLDYVICVSEGDR